VRRRARVVPPEAETPPRYPARENDRKFLYIGAGALILALAAFVCGVQMGKALSDLRWVDEAKPLIQDRKGEAPPFRFMEKGKDLPSVPDAKARPSEGEGSPKEASPARSSPKGISEKPGSPPKASSPPPKDEGKPTPAKTKFTLQVGAYNNSQEAQELVQQLKKKGYDAYIASGAAAAKGVLHRVRVGHFQTLQEARQFALAFEKKENLKPIISSLQSP
jgi:hypothetical protein